MSNQASDFECPPEHREAYGEACDQMMRAVLDRAAELQATLIFREMDHGLKYNAILTGALIGGLVPLLMQFKPKHDEALIASMTGSLPTIFGHARKQADKLLQP
jgi:hypothetical protein